MMGHWVKDLLLTIFSKTNTSETLEKLQWKCLIEGYPMLQIYNFTVITYVT